MNNSKYLYFINYRDEQKDLCYLEMKSIFGITPITKYVYSNLNINPSRSVFIKWRLELSYQADSLDNLEILVKKEKLTVDNYKIHYIKNDKDVDYNQRLNSMTRLGNTIEGNYSLNDPDYEYGITKIDNIWVFGNFVRNDASWRLRKQKPHNYSFALDVWLAKTLINIALENDFNKRIVDPCCGIGTVLIEGLEMGANIKGYDINNTVVNHTNQNLQFFGFDPNVECKDIIDILYKYDVAIIDLPYGKFIKADSDKIPHIIRNSKRISNKVIFVSMSDISEILRENKLSVIDTCILSKRSKFKRYITICI